MFSFVNKNSSEKVETNMVETDFDALQKARKDLIGEIEAIMEYDNHIHTTRNELAKKTWEHIKEEELHHVGELLGLLKYLDVNQVQHVLNGMKEFEELEKNKNNYENLIVFCF